MDEEEPEQIIQENIPPAQHLPNTDLMQWVLQSSDIIGNLKNFLEGVSPKLLKGRIVMIPVADPLMNDEGISVTLMMMHSANKQAMMSELDDVDVRDIVGDFNDDYIDVMAVNTNRYKNRWNVRPDKRSLIVTTVISQLRISLLMARDAGFRNSVNKMEQVSRQIIDQPNQKSSIFGRRPR